MSFIPGDPRRATVGRAVGATLLAAAVFLVYVVAVKDVPALTAAATWTDDPYDAFFSFAIFFVAVVAVVNLVRAAECAKAEPLSARLAVDLVRGSRVVGWCLVITLATGWLSVGMSGAEEPNSGLGGIVVAGLAGASLIALVALFAVMRAEVPDVRPASGDDWLTDVVGLLARRSHWARRHGEGLIVLAEAGRRHALALAALAAIGVGAFVGIGGWLEGDPVLLVAILAMVGAGGMLAFLVIVGSYLGLARPAPRRSGARPAAIAVVAAAASTPVAVAFRDGLWWIVGSNADNAKLPQLAALLGTVAVGVFAVSLVVGLIVVDRGRR